MSLPETIAEAVPAHGFECLRVGRSGKLAKGECAPLVWGACLLGKCYLLHYRIVAVVVANLRHRFVVVAREAVNAVSDNGREDGPFIKGTSGVSQNFLPKPA